MGGCDQDQYGPYSTAVLASYRNTEQHTKSLCLACPVQPVRVGGACWKLSHQCRLYSTFRVYLKTKNCHFLLSQKGNFYWLITKVRKCCLSVEQLTGPDNLVREYQLPLWRGSVISPVITQPSDPIRLSCRTARNVSSHVGLKNDRYSFHGSWFFVTNLRLRKSWRYSSSLDDSWWHRLRPDRGSQEWSWSYLRQISSISLPVRYIVHLRFTLNSSSPVLTPEVCILISGRIRPKIPVIDMKCTLSHVSGRVQRPCR